MKVKTVYQCEKCGQEYDDEDACKECESQHIMPKELDTKYHYRFKSRVSSSAFKYPKLIRVLMEDGCSVIYSYEMGPAQIGRFQEESNG